jgi:general secretion pathway protein C
LTILGAFIAYNLSRIRFNMQNIRYHIIHSASVVFFAFSFAFTVNSVVRQVLAPSAPVRFSPSESVSAPSLTKQVIDINSIIESGIFKKASTDSSAAAAQTADLSEFSLLGTITANPAYSRALIKKRSENNSKIFAVNEDVFGYKLVRISDTAVYLKQGDKTTMLSMIEKKDATNPNQPPAPGAGEKVKKTLSKSEMLQITQKNMDKLIIGLKAAPHVVNGKFEGYRLFAVPNDNYLYTLGARNGDIIKRINGHPIDSTETLMKIWTTLPQETRVILDIDRGGNIVTYDYTFTE